MMKSPIPIPSKRISVEDYFKLAEASPIKLEYNAGEIINRPDASYAHCLIASNTIFSITVRLQGRCCEALGSDLRIGVASDRYCYPDVTIICGEPIFDPLNTGMTVTNPQAIFEVLSPSTEIADRGEKFFRYIRLPSLREYFLVSQSSPRIESFVRREDGSWSVGQVADGLDQSLIIGSLQLEIPLGEIYENIRFDPTGTT